MGASHFSLRDTALYLKFFFLIYVCCVLFFTLFMFYKGIKVTYDARNTPGNRVTSVKVTCTSCDIPEYEDLIMNAEYKVIVTSYLAKGGDGYDTIKNNKKNHVTGELIIVRLGCLFVFCAHDIEST